jgi:NAD(P)-dependent dehydrogenase (short-subunit alcohol dehydrogenase family)
MDKPVALITGVGPGTGAAMARRLAEGGYAVAMLARDKGRLAELEQQIPGSSAFACDVLDEKQINDTLDSVFEKLGAPSVFIHNAVGGVFGTFMEIDPAVLERNFQINTMAFLRFARRLAPSMIEMGRGTIIATGNTSAFRGKATFAGFAPSKAAQRILAESMARDLGPKGVHVAYIMIDAVIDLDWTRNMFTGRSDDFFIKPAAIAEQVWNTIQQDRSAWSFNVEIRPFGEQW